MPLSNLRGRSRDACLFDAARRGTTLAAPACAAFLLLLQAGETAGAHRAKCLARYHISQGGFNILLLLSSIEGLYSTAAELAQAAGVSRATMTGLLDTLEKDGMVARAALRHDRRAVGVQLTPHGASVLEAVLPDYLRCIAQLMEPLGAGETRTLISLLEKIRSAPETVPGADAV
jgi:DNA-binding MarR family transcriptional regulator